MLMRKENYSCIITKHFGSNTDEIVTTRYDKRTGVTTEVVEPLRKYATHPTGYKNQLLDQGYKLVKMRGGQYDVFGTIE